MPLPTALIAQPDAVTLDLPPGTGESAIRFLHGKLVGVAGINHPDLFLKDLLERSTASSVCIAADLALPHARTAAVDRLILAVGRSTGPIVFDDLHPQVRLVFLVGTTKQAVTDYLQLVAAISRLLKNETVRSGLMLAKTVEEFRAILARGAPK